MNSRFKGQWVEDNQGPQTVASKDFDTAENVVGVDYAEDESAHPIHVEALRKCKQALVNPALDVEVERRRKKSRSTVYAILTLIYDFVAAFYIYFVHTVSAEGFVVVANAVLVTALFCVGAPQMACKLDFSILSFAVVFPLTFLIQQAYTRREAALLGLCDFRALMLQVVLATLTWDWVEGGKSGRQMLPPNFNTKVYNDAREMVQLLYQYLSMPTVSHARHRLVPSAREDTRRVHAMQNDVVKRVYVCFEEFSEHVEVLKAYGLQVGEASRINQYHWYLQQRFEALRFLKYYRTPQATRSFGRVYVLVLPWLFGPYFAWVQESAGLAFALTLAGFSFLVLLGLLNTQKFLEDPFVEFDNGVDFIKLTYELASALQGLDLHFKRAEMRRRAAASMQGGADTISNPNILSQATIKSEDSDMADPPEPREHLDWRHPLAALSAAFSER